MANGAKKQKGPASGPGPFGGKDFLQLQTGATEMAPAGAAEAKPAGVKIRRFDLGGFAEGLHGDTHTRGQRGQGFLSQLDRSVGHFAGFGDHLLNG
jgi:hypothetical protein